MTRKEQARRRQETKEKYLGFLEKYPSPEPRETIMDLTLDWYKRAYKATITSQYVYKCLKEGGQK